MSETEKKNDYVAIRGIGVDGKEYKTGDPLKLTAREAAQLGDTRVALKSDWEEYKARKARSNPMYQPLNKSDVVIATHDSGDQTAHKDPNEHGPYEVPPKEGGIKREFDDNGRIKRPRTTFLPQGDIPLSQTIGAAQAAQAGVKSAPKEVSISSQDDNLSKTPPPEPDDDDKKSKSAAPKK